MDDAASRKLRALVAESPSEGAGGLVLCPRLGLAGDPDSQAAYPRRDHCCLNRGGAVVALAWQTRYCLTAAHRTCPYFAEQSIAVAPSPGAGRRGISRVLIAIVVLGLLLASIGLALAAWDRADNDAPERAQVIAASATQPGAVDGLAGASPSPSPTPNDPAPAVIVPEPTVAPPAPSPTADPTATLSATPTPVPSPTSTPELSPEPSPPPAPTFAPTHRTTTVAPVNLREGPTVSSGIVRLLDAGTPLRFLGEEQSGDGATWMHFETEDGASGWIRSIDAVPAGG